MAAQPASGEGPSAPPPSWTGDVWIRDEWTEEDRSAARQRLDAAASARQRDHQRAFDEFRRNASTNWNVFYNQNKTNFFKDRHYLHKAFPREFGWLYASSDGDAQAAADATPAADDVTVRIVEIGCGVGNAILPLLEQHTELMQRCKEQSIGGTSLCNNTNENRSTPPQLHIHCLDFAPTAIQLLKEDPRFVSAAEEGRATAHVYDLSSMHPSTVPIGGPSLDQSGTPQTLAHSADVAILLFCLSAIGPHPSPSLERAARHVIAMLRPGGTLVIRDYGRLDEAQMKLGAGDKELGENFYRKGDGTGCYYFELDDLKELFVNKNDADDKLDLLELDYIQRVYRNRGDGTERRRVWVQGRFRKPLTAEDGPECDISRPLDGSAAALDCFLHTLVQRWDDYYRDLPPAQTPTSLPSNILQMFPNEFAPWQPPTGKGLRKGQPRSTSQYASAKEVTIIDLGCGLGNDALLNILERQQMHHAEGLQNQQDEDQSSSEEPMLNVHFLDASKEAIRKLQSDPRYQKGADSNNERITAQVFDLASTLEVPSPLEGSADIIILLFTLSAIGPYNRRGILDSQPSFSGVINAVRNAANMLKPGGVILFRDFARYDDDQLQLNSVVGAQLCNNFYTRALTGNDVDNGNGKADSTDDLMARGVGCHFFDLDEVRELFANAGLEVLQLEYVTRVYKKSGKNGRDCSKNGGAVERRRIWINGRFRKPLS